MWVKDVNARGELLDRKVELTAYDDQGSASATPAIYAKLLDVARIDRLIAPYGTVPTAPLMGMVKSRGKLLMGNFSFQVNHVVKHDNLPVHVWTGYNSYDRNRDPLGDDFRDFTWDGLKQ